MVDELMFETKVIRDNIHGNITINYQIIWDLINTPEMQRLRRIHQLGGTFMVFPSAEHSRFTHSLGVYHLVNRIINEVIKEEISNYDKIVALCAGLLHDIGHGPYSHAFEDVFNTDHENMSQRIICEDSNINKVLNKYDSHLASNVAAVINHTHSNKLLIQLISSQVDADRMDYLLRDATNCGVSYGHFDLERLLRSMVVKDNIIVFKESGVHALEDYIFARYHMYWQVYLHQTANSYEIILNKLLRRVKELYENNYSFKHDINLLIPFLKNEIINIEDYLLLDESILIYYFKNFINEEDYILKELSYCFINRKLFKALDISSEQEGLNLINKIVDDTIKKNYFFEILQAKSSFYKYYGEINSQSINIITKDNKIEELANASNLVEAIVNSAKDKIELKLYYHQDYRSVLNE
ncbi:MAG: HD domain-containing protein [Bacilli bacterium]|jgi:HD superfamily phosphohydrolase|nr:HD domain-containing protein [Bacilli bacterium]